MRTKFRTRLLPVIMLVFWLFPLAVGQAAPTFQITTPQENARRLLDTLTPEERVGQLFLVTFDGPEAGAGSETGQKIFDLIVNRHVGGVILRASNDNFTGSDQTIPVTFSLIDQLQRNVYIASQQTQINPITSEPFEPAYIPLFIGVSQEGDGYPYDQILYGLTPLPSQMSIGATWQPILARQTGAVLGNELSLLGINLLLGPSLDVLLTPKSESGGDLGVRAFGGDPFWVGEMGQEFITGVHQGSNSTIAVVAKHFPGFGGSDRLPEEEVATVRKSLEQLKQIELAPFFAVTGNAPDPLATTDALLTSHIRYQGFQGNIRATTKPVSFDPTAFSQLMGLQQFSTWRAGGGVMISDDLGSRAVRRFYDPTGQTFNGRLVALEAFLAGNDMLYLGDFVSSGDEDTYTTILNTLGFFAQKYREDTAFALRVDDSVLRILALKYRLYDNTFTLSGTLTDPNALNRLGQSGQVTFDTAQQAATLISPSLDELDDAIPAPPGRNDHIVFISDTRIYQQCSTCRQDYTLEATTLEDAVLRLYSSSGQVLPGNLISYAYQDLMDMLLAGTGVMQIENDLRQANWIVFIMDDISPLVPVSQALRDFLDQRPDLYQQKNLIVFTLNAPYYLDATDISKFTAYYGLFSRSAKFFDVAARLLFKELQPNGNLSVSVPGVDYDLIVITSPDPTQVIPLTLDITDNVTSGDTATPVTTPIQNGFRVGDTIPVRTGTIVDHNGNPVPDNTVVQFILTYEGEALPSQQVEAQTFQGTAKATLRVDRSGQLHIQVESDPALTSDILIYDIPQEGITPTEPPPTATATQSPTTTEMPTVTPTITPTPESTVPVPLKGTVKFKDWLVALVVSLGIGGANIWLANRITGMRWAIRTALFALIGGMATYSYLAVGLPGSEALIENIGGWGMLLVVVLGAGIGTGIAWLWREIEGQKAQKM